MNRTGYFIYALCVVQISIAAAQPVELKAKLVNSKTNEVLPYTNVKFKKYDFGTACDERGAFVISVDASLISNDTIQFSLLGYKLMEIPVKKFLQTNPDVVKLEEQSTLLSEVTISASRKDWIIELIEHVIDSIPGNYMTEPFLMQTQVTSTMNKSGLRISSLLSAKIYFNSGYNDHKKRNDKFIIEGSCFREYDSLQKKWITMAQPNMGLNNDILGIFIRDFVSRRDDNFLNKSNIRHYSFDLESEDKSSLVIRFQSNAMKPGIVPYMNLKAFTGRIYIQKATYAISKMEARAVIDQKAMRKSLNKSTVGELEITTEYKQTSSGKFYWARSSYKDNYINNTEAVNVNTFLKAGVQSIKKDDFTYKNQNLCETN